MVTCFLCGFLLGQGMGPFLHFWGTQQRTPEASRKQLISPVASRQSDNSVDISGYKSSCVAPLGAETWLLSLTCLLQGTVG